MKKANVWDKNKTEKRCEKWFKDNDFEVFESKQYMSKTNYKISKDGIEYVFELPYAVADIEKYMALFNISFEMKKEIIRMKAELQNE